MQYQRFYVEISLALCVRIVEAILSYDKAPRVDAWGFPDRNKGSNRVLHHVSDRVRHCRNTRNFHEFLRNRCIRYLVIT